LLSGQHFSFGVKEYIFSCHVIFLSCTIYHDFIFVLCVLFMTSSSCQLYLKMFVPASCILTLQYLPKLRIWHFPFQPVFLWLHIPHDVHWRLSLPSSLLGDLIFLLTLMRLSLPSSLFITLFLYSCFWDFLFLSSATWDNLI